MKFRINGEKFKPTPENTTLYTFAGQAMFNHVFLQLNKEGEEVSGAYIFAPSEAFNALARLVIEKDYPMVLNMREVPECDQRAFFNANLEDLASMDSFPEDWE